MNKLFRVLIVDDEDIDREGLKRYVEWEDMGFEVADNVESAQKALEFIENEAVDVVLTDIIMPDMSGLELLDEIKKRNSDIKTVIISGYGEFEYAQKAIRLGVYDFLTKPVNFADLKRIFSSIRNLLNEEMNERKKDEEYVGLMREQLLNNLAKGIYQNRQEVGKKIEEKGLSLDWERFCILRVFMLNDTDKTNEIICIDDYSVLKQKVSAKLKVYITLMGKYNIFNNDISEICILFEPSQDESFKLLEDFIEDIRLELHCTSYIGVGNTYDDINMVAQSYMEAGKALEYRITKRDSSVLIFKHIDDFFKGTSLITDEERMIILLYLTNRDKDGLIKYIQEILFSKCNNNEIDINTIYNTCIEIYLIINKFICNITDIKQQNHNGRIFIKNLLEKESVEEIKEDLALCIHKSIDSMETSKAGSNNMIIDYAKKYINEHFNEEITLNKLSKILFVHPRYLSQLFKEKSGENFIDYLTKVRIYKSKELLKNVSLKVYDITEMIGYDSPKYFSKLFKDIVGMTPKEYRDSVYS